MIAPFVFFSAILDRFGKYFGPCVGSSGEEWAAPDPICAGVDLRITQKKYNLQSNGNYETTFVFSTNAASASTSSFFIKLYFSKDASAIVVSFHVCMYYLCSPNFDLC